MNPQCQTLLFVSEASIGEMAHILPNEIGGDVTYENLILLCSNCHTSIDKNRTGHTEPKLRNWKIERNRDIDTYFNEELSSFGELKIRVEPILSRNLQIFNSYGPSSEESGDTERGNMWKIFEPEIISNNEKLKSILIRNIKLLHYENREIVERFVNHVEEFKVSRDYPKNIRYKLFPNKLNSVFGVEQVVNELAPSISALQNFVDNLTCSGQFIELQFTPDPIITYLENDEILQISLEDRPRIQQIYWNYNCYRRQSSGLKLESLIWMLRWLENINISYTFETNDIARFSLNGKFDVVFVYEYIVSFATMLNIKPAQGLIVVNLHHWNGAPFSNEAMQYASTLEIETMTQKEFFVFCHRKVR